MKKLLLLLALTCWAGAWADTSYTSYLATTSSSTSTATWTCATGSFATTGTQFTGGMTNVAESYLSGTFSAGKILYQTVTGLPAGSYTVTFYATVCCANGYGTTAGDSIAQVYANDTYQDIAVLDSSSCNLGSYLRTLECTVDEDGTLEFGIYCKAAGGNWAMLKAASLTNTTAYDDVTSTYITNPSFEDDSVEDLTAASNGGYYVTELTGWTLSLLENEKMTAELMTSGLTESDNDMGAPGTPTDGTYMLYLRNSWYTGTASISQTTKTLPAGIYRLTADSRAARKSSETVTLSVAGQTADLSASATTFGDWTTSVIDFTLSEAQTVDIEVDITFSSSGYAAVLLDNFVLSARPEESVDLEELTAAEGDMMTSLDTAQKEAIETYQSNPTTTTLALAKAAILAAQASADYYAEIATYYEALDEEGKKAYDATETGKAYSEKTLATDTDYTADMLTAQLAQTTADSDMSLAITTNSTYTASQSDSGQSYANDGGWQVYVGDGFSAGDVLSQTLSGLPTGNYEITFMAVTTRAWSSSAGVGDNIAVVYANSTAQKTTVADDDAGTFATIGVTYTLTCTVGSAGTLEYGIRNSASGGTWYMLKGVSLTYKGQDYGTVTAATGDMMTSLDTAQKEAIAAYEENPSADTYDAAVAAVAAAQASADYYAEIAAYYDTFDAAGQAAYAQTTTGAAYVAKTLATDTDYLADIIAAQQSQTTAGVDMSLILSTLTWTCQQGNGPTTMQTTATETYSDNTNYAIFAPGKIMYMNAQGFTAGKYQVKFHAFVNSCNGVTDEEGDEYVAAYANGTQEGFTLGANKSQTLKDDDSSNLHTVECTVSSALGGTLEFGVMSLTEGGNWCMAEAESITYLGAADEETTTWAGDYAEDEKVSEETYSYSVIKGSNLVTNGSFEQGVAGWLVGDGASTTYAGSASIADFVISPAYGYDGGAYINMAGDATAGTKSIKQAIAVSPSTTYFYAYSVRAEADASSASTTGFEKITKSGDYYATVTDGWYTNPSDIKGTGWTTYTGLFTTDSETEYVGFRSSWNTVMLDGIQLYEVEEVSVATFTVHECEAEVDDWTTTITDGTLAYNSTSTESDESGLVTPFVQVWRWSGNGNLGDGTISHATIANLNEGEYRVSMLVRCFNEAGTDQPSGITFAANDVTVDMADVGTYATYGTSACVLYANLCVDCTVDDSGELDIHFTTSSVENCNWIAFKNLKVITTTAPTVTAATGDMMASLATAQTEAIEAYTASATVDNYNTAKEAIAAAQASADYYAEIAAYYTALDTDGKAKFDATTTGAAYAAKTLATTTSYTADMLAAQLAQTSAVADLSLAVTTATWQGDNGTYQTYSTGYECYNDSVIGAGRVLYQSISGLPAGTYTVEFYGATSIANGAEEIGSDGDTCVAYAYANYMMQTVKLKEQSATNLPTLATDSLVQTITDVYVAADGKLEYGWMNATTGGNWYLAQAKSLKRTSNDAPTCTNWDGDVEEESQIVYDGKIYQTTSANMVQNGSFDEGLRHWLTTSYTAQALAPDFMVTSTGGYDKGAYVTVQTDGDPDTQYSLQQTFEVTKGELYYYRFYCKASASDAHDSTGFEYPSVDDDGNITAGDIATGSVNYGTGWSLNQGVLTAESDLLAFRCSAAEGKMLDGVQLYPIELAYKYFQTIHTCDSDDEYDEWTRSNTDNNDTDTYKYQHNTWSTEGDLSGMVTPFNEYWVYRGSSLPDETFTHTTFENLEAGDYTVSLFVRLFNEANTTTYPSGAYLVVNDTEIDLNEEGTQAIYNSTSAEVFATYMTSLTLKQSGDITVKLVVKDANFNWMAWRDLNVIYATDTKPAYTYSLAAAAVDSIAAQRGDTVTVSYVTTTDNVDAAQTFAAGQTVTVTLDTSTTLTAQVDTQAQTVSFVLPTDLDIYATHTLAISEGALVWTPDSDKTVTSAAFTATLTPYASSVYLYKDDQFLSRKGSASAADAFGVPVDIVTTLAGYSVVTYVDSQAEIDETITPSDWTIKTPAERKTIVDDAYAAALEALHTGFSTYVAGLGGEDVTQAFAEAALCLDGETYDYSADTDWNISMDLTMASTAAVNKKTNGVEIYQGYGTITQTVKGLPAGLYRVTLQGYIRQGSNDNCNTYADLDLSYATLTANGVTTNLCTWYNARQEYDTVSTTFPNTMAEGAQLLAKGCAVNTVYCQVDEEDDTLAVTINVPGYVASQWVMVRNLNVTRLLDSDSYSTAALNYTQEVLATQATEDGDEEESTTVTDETELAGYYTTFASGKDKKVPVYLTPDASDPATLNMAPQPYICTAITTNEGSLSFTFQAVPTTDDGLWYQLAAGQGYLFRKLSSTNTGSMALTLTSGSGATVTGNLLHGVTDGALTVDASNYGDIYVLNYKSSSTLVGTYDYEKVYGKGLAFYQMASGSSVAVGKAYIDITDATTATTDTEDNGALVARMVFTDADGQVTGIATTSLPAAHGLDIYDMAGRKLSRAGKGIYIVNGQKVLY